MSDISAKILDIFDFIEIKVQMLPKPMKKFSCLG